MREEGEDIWRTVLSKDYMVEQKHSASVFTP
jgi:hypothetical protein